MSWREERATFISQQNSMAINNESQSQKKKSAKSSRLSMFSRSRFKLSVSGWFGQYLSEAGTRILFSRGPGWSPKLLH